MHYPTTAGYPMTYRDWTAADIEKLRQVRAFHAREVNFWTPLKPELKAFAKEQIKFHKSLEKAAAMWLGYVLNNNPQRKDFPPDLWDNLNLIKGSLDVS